MTAHIIVKYPKRINKTTYNQTQKIYLKYFKEIYYSMSLAETNLIATKYPKSIAIIYDSKKVIGSIELIPTNKKIMNKFLALKIGEQELFTGSMKLEKNEINSLYICFAVIEKKYRHKGIILKSIIYSINHILKTYEINHLFVWPYSEEGLNLAKKIAKHFNKKLYIRKD